MTLEFTSEQDFDICMEIWNENILLKKTTLPAMQKKYIKFSEEYSHIKVTFYKEAEYYKFKVFWGIISTVLGLLLVFLSIYDGDGNGIIQLGGDEENLIDTYITFSGNCRNNRVQIIYRKNFIDGMPFNIGEVDKVSLDIKVEYIKNALYKDTVRFYIAGYLLYVLPGSLVLMIFQIVCWNKGWKVLTFLAAVILIYCLYEYAIKVREEYNKWRNLLKD